MKDTQLKSLQAQYRDASNDHRHYGSLIWQLPALAIIVGGSLLSVAFNKNTAPFIRTAILGVASVFQFVMTSALVRYRLFQKRRRYELGEMDKLLASVTGHTPKRGFKTDLAKLKDGQEVADTGLEKSIFNSSSAYLKLFAFMRFLTTFILILFIYSALLAFPSFNELSRNILNWP